jgi:hypothetical protein
MRTSGSVALWTLVLVVSMSAFALAQAGGAPKEQPKENNISGLWEMTVTTPHGEQTNDVTFTQEKEQLKVTMTSPMGPVDGDGSVKGNAIQWSVTINTPNGAFVIGFTGKIDGDAMSGDAQMGEFGTAPWSAKRKKA